MEKTPLGHEIKSTNSYSIKIWIAQPKSYGGKDDPRPWAVQVQDELKKYCETAVTVDSTDPPGLCVTVTYMTFIHKDAVEYGFCVGLVNYPRFPKLAYQLYDHAKRIALLLMERFQQNTALIDTPNGTHWVYRTEKIEVKE